MWANQWLSSADKVSEEDKTVISEEANNTVVESSQESYELEVINGDRVFKSEVAPDSRPKELAIDSLKVDITDDYYQFKELFTDNNNIHQFIKGMDEANREQLTNGLYTEKVIVHDVNYLSSDEATRVYSSMNDLTEINPYDYKVVKVDYILKQNDELNKVAQFSSGEYTRYCVVIMENEGSDWKIYTTGQ